MWILAVHFVEIVRYMYSLHMYTYVQWMIGIFTLFETSSIKHLKFVFFATFLFFFYSEINLTVAFHISETLVDVLLEELEQNYKNLVRTFENLLFLSYDQFWTTVVFNLPV